MLTLDIDALTVQSFATDDGSVPAQTASAAEDPVSEILGCRTANSCPPACNTYRVTNCV